MYTIDGRLYVVWHGCVVDGLEHAVTDEEFAGGERRHLGSYVAVCGHITRPGSMLSPSRSTCSNCVSRVRTAALSEQSPALSSRAGVMRRLLAWFQSPVVPSPVVASPGRDGRSALPVDSSCGQAALASTDHQWMRPFA